MIRIFGHMVAPDSNAPFFLPLPQGRKNETEIQNQLHHEAELASEPASIVLNTLTTG